MNVHESHQAAGVVATTDRSEVKQEWHKKPLALHVIIAVGTITIAIFINIFFPLNIFWKLLVGGGLMWVGNKVAASKNSVANLWGKILKGLGLAILVVTLLNSGVRVVAEKSVLWMDDALKGQSSATASENATLPRLFGPDDLEEIKMGGAPVGTTATLTIPINGRVKFHIGTPLPKQANFWPCLKANGGFEPPLQFETVAGNGTAVMTLRLRKNDFIRAYEMGVKELNLTAVKAAGAENPCPQHLF